MRYAAIILVFIANAMAMNRLHALDLRLEWLGSLLVLAVATFLAVVAHEAGHAIAARRRGARITAIAALPFEVRLRPLRFGWMPRGVDRDVGGYVEYEQVQPTRRDDLIIAAAGPMANFALGLSIMVGLQIVFASITPTHNRPGPVVVPLHLAKPPAEPLLLPSEERIQALLEAHRQRDRLVGVSHVLSALAIISFAMGVANLLPFPGSDGRRIVQALSRHGFRRRHQE